MQKIIDIYKLPASIFFIIALAVSSATSGCNGSGSSSNVTPYVAGTDWTIMIYGDGDNDLENFLLLDVEEMKAGFTNGQGYNLIILADRLGYTRSRAGFNTYFTDTRLYRITAGRTTRIGGSTQFPEITTSSNYEADMGDATTLKKFIRFCKENYPATHYALILWDHGLGPMKKGGIQEDAGAITNKGICVDMSSTVGLNYDFLYTAEISDALTSEESVDLLGFDACLMGTIEVAYQYKPDPANPTKFSANILAASAPSEWGYGWKYDEILKRIKSGGGNTGETSDATGKSEEIYDPVSMTAENLCEVILEEQQDSLEQYNSTQPVLDQANDQSFSCYDLSKAAAVKTAVDTLAVQLDTDNEQVDFETIRGNAAFPSAMYFFDLTSTDEWLQDPLFDLYDLCYKTSISSNFTSTAQGYASNVMTAADDMIIYSFGGSKYTGFLNGKSGLAIFFPDGSKLYNGKRHWAYQWWYSPLDTNIDYGTGYLYGKLAWCIGGTIPNTVENWFELLDKWYDTANDNTNNNLNAYIW